VVNFNDVKERVGFEDAIKLLGITLTEGESNGVKVFRGPCPHCQTGGQRALVVTPTKGFYCFSKKAGGDVIQLAAHVRGTSVKDAAEWLLKPAQEQNMNSRPGGLKPLEYLDARHEKVLALVTEETALFLGMGYSSKGIMRGTVAIPIHEIDGTLIAYVGIEEDGTYRFPNGFPRTAHIFNIHRVIANDVHLMPSVEDCLRAMENGIDQPICFFNNCIDPIQLKALADILENKKATLIV
jgi:uncharacterized protein (DUF2237 family)